MTWDSEPMTDNEARAVPAALESVVSWTHPHARAVPVEGDRERLAALMESRLGDALDGYGDPHAWALLLADDILRAGVSLTGSGLDVERLARAMALLDDTDRPSARLIAREYAALSGESGEPNR